MTRFSKYDIIYIQRTSGVTVMWLDIMHAAIGFILGVGIFVGIVVWVLNMAGDPRNQWW